MLPLQFSCQPLAFFHMPQELCDQHAAGYKPRAFQTLRFILRLRSCLMRPFHPAEQRHVTDSTQPLKPEETRITGYYLLRSHRFYNTTPLFKFEYMCVNAGSFKRDWICTYKVLNLILKKNKETQLVTMGQENTTLLLFLSKKWYKSNHNMNYRWIWFLKLFSCHFALE